MDVFFLVTWATLFVFSLVRGKAIKLDSSFSFRFFLHEIGTHSGKKCAIKIILRNRCEKPRRGLIHFLYLFSSIFPLLGLILLPLLYFFKKLVCYAPTHFFAWLCSTLQITHTYSRTPREHCTTTTPIKTLHLFDKTSPVTNFTLTNPPSPLWQTTRWIYFTRLLLRCHHKLFSVCGFTYPSFLILYFLLVHTFWSFSSFL